MLLTWFGWSIHSGSHSLKVLGTGNLIVDAIKVSIDFVHEYCYQWWDVDNKLSYRHLSSIWMFALKNFKNKCEFQGRALICGKLQLQIYVGFTTFYYRYSRIQKMKISVSVKFVVRHSVLHGNFSGAIKYLSFLATPNPVKYPFSIFHWIFNSERKGGRFL